MGQTLSNFKRDAFDNTLSPVVLEIIRLFPDSLVISSGIFALATLSFPYAMMFVSLLEATFLFHGIRYLTSFLNMVDPTSAAHASLATCRTGFSTVNLTSLSLFANSSKSTFPSAPIYIVCVAASYLFSSLQNLSDELSALGPKYSSRYYTSLVLLFSLLVVFCAFRLASSCDSFGTLIGTVPIGIVVGILLLWQNMRLLGKPSVNLLGIPLLSNKTADGKTIYVCPTTNQ